MAKFVVYFNGEPLKTYEFDEPVISIGRLPENTISIANMGISRRHAKIEEDADRKYIMLDLNSLNGTYVNGKRVKKIALNSGDKITIGKYTILYEESTPGENSTISGSNMASSQQFASDSPSGGRSEVQTMTYPQTDNSFNDAITKPPTGVIDITDLKAVKEENVPVFIETNKHVVYKLDKSFLTIGSGDEDDIFITGFMIGAGQITLEKQDDGIHLTANKMIGKIKINGKSCRSHVLQHKDRIEIGASTFRFMENG